MEQEVFKALVALVLVVLVGVFFKLQFKIAKPIELEAPEVLPETIEHCVGDIVEKNGQKVEVVECDKGCSACALHDENRIESCKEKCMDTERTKGDSIIFKKVTMKQIFNVPSDCIASIEQTDDKIVITFEPKKIEKIKWVPEYSEPYSYVDKTGEIKHTTNDQVEWEQKMFSVNNFFKPNSLDTEKVKRLYAEFIEKVREEHGIND